MPSRILSMRKDAAAPGLLPAITGGATVVEFDPDWL
jgi:hypothetical protein